MTASGPIAAAQRLCNGMFGVGEQGRRQRRSLAQLNINDLAPNPPRQWSRRAVAVIGEIRVLRCPNMPHAATLCLAASGIRNLRPLVGSKKC